MYLSPQYKEFLEHLRKVETPKLPHNVHLLTQTATHNYELTLSRVDAIFLKPIYKRVIRSKAFQRLKNIHFLGSIDYVVDPEKPKPNKRHNRYQHSLGVAILALQYSQLRQLSEHQETICVLSALLHDIGHAPLSHSLESVFKYEYGIGHHIVAERIIRGDVALGQDLQATLVEFNINPFELLEVINGTGPEPYSEIFSHAINIDTIEAILRSSTYIYGGAIFWPPREILHALISRDAEATKVLDSFWRLKNDVYHLLINHRMGVLADFLCQQYMKDNLSNFFEDYYYVTESSLKKKHPALFRQLSELTTKEPKELLPHATEIPYLDRSFVINENVRLESIRSIDGRYTQTKKQAIYQLP